MHIVSLLFVFVGSAVTSQPTSNESNGQTWIVDANEVTLVDVTNESGRTEIRSVAPGGDITVLGKKIGWDSEPCRLSVTRYEEQKKVSVVAKNTSWFSLASCDTDLVIEVPSTASLKLTMGSADLSVAGSFPSVEFAVGSSNVQATGTFGVVKGKAGTGVTVIKGAAGPVNLASGSGDIELHVGANVAEDAISVSTGTGNATVYMPSGAPVTPVLSSSEGETNLFFQ